MLQSMQGKFTSRQQKFYHCAPHICVRVASTRTSQLYNNHIIRITYINFHQNSDQVTNLHVHVFIKDPINITLETQNKKKKF